MFHQFQYPENITLNRGVISTNGKNLTRTKTHFVICIFKKISFNVNYFFVLFHVNEINKKYF